MAKKYLGDMRLMDTPEDYGKLGIKKGTPEIWEDGMRTHGGPGSYEWWYVDSEFDNGMVIVATFYTKNHFDEPGPAHPTAEVMVTYPDGRSVRREITEEKGKALEASRERCDVTIGNSFLKYVEGNYLMVFDEDGLKLELNMTSTLPMYRPAAGVVQFGNTSEIMGWLVGQPSSKIEGTLELEGETVSLVGKGYHDHNWGAGSLFKQFNHWYWCRASAGDYTFITAHNISNETYGYSDFKIFMLAKDGEILDNDLSKVTVKRSDQYQHEFTKKFMDNHLTFTQPTEDGITYTIEYMREKDIVTDSLLNQMSMPSFVKKLARMTVANPTYVRCLGKVRLTIDDHGEKTVVENEGLWEQMFFGNNKEPVFGRK